MLDGVLAETVATLFAIYQPLGVVDPLFWFIERRYWVAYTAWITMFEVTVSCRGLDELPSDQPVNTCRTPRDALIRDWICTVTSPVGTLVSNWVEVKLYLTPLINAQMFPKDAMFAGMLMERVGPTFTLNDATLFALLGSFIV
jgi:hypothetical protein